MHAPSTLLQAPTLLSMSLGLFAALQSQSHAADSKALRSPEDTLLEEIIVTADRKESFGADFVQAGTFRGAKLLDTPLTVNVLPRELLDAQLATQLHDVLRNTAGVTSAQLNNAVYSNMAIRGIVVENRGNYRLNGSLPIVNLIDLPLENKERVEVLKGVSALYYGFTTPSGIINLTSKRSPSGPLFDLTTFANSHGSLGAHVDWGDNFVDDALGVRVNALYGSNEIGVDETDGFRSFGSVALDFRPTDDLTVELDAEYIRKKVTEPVTYFVGGGPGGTLLPLPPLPDPEKNLGGTWQYGDGYETNVLLNARYRLARDWEISVQGGRSYLDRDRFYSQFQSYDLTTGDGVVDVTLTNGNVNENVNYRTELYGAFLTGPIKHDLTIGFTQNNRDAEVTSNPTARFAQNLYNPTPLPYTPLPPRVVTSESEIKDQGVYAFDRMSYRTWLQLLVGVRYTDYQSSTYRPLTAVSTRYSEEEVSPAVGLVVKPREWMSLYGTYIEGLEEGGVAPVSAVNAGEVMPAAVSEQFELGVKLEYGALLLNLAYFDIDRSSSFVDPLTNRFVQDGRSTYSGFEFSATGEITPNLSVYATAMDLDAEQEKTANPAQIGLRPENTAEYTGSLFLEYRLPMVSGLAVSGGAFLVGDRAVNVRNQAFVGGYTTYDVGARYSTEVADRPTSFRLTVNNVMDKRYWAATASNLLNPNLPRTAKFSVTMSF